MKTIKSLFVLLVVCIVFFDIVETGEQRKKDRELDALVLQSNQIKANVLDSTVITRTNYGHSTNSDTARFMPTANFKKVVPASLKATID